MTGGLVVSLEPGSPDAVQSIAAIHASPVFTMEAERGGWQVPVALEARTAEECEHWCDWLRRLPGVFGVEVVFVHWDEAEDGDAGD